MLTEAKPHPPAALELASVAGPPPHLLTTKQPQHQLKSREDKKTGRATYLIPALNSSRNRVQDNHNVQHARVRPALRLLDVQRLLLIGAQLGDGLIRAGALRSKRASLEKLKLVGQAICLRELLDVGEELLAGNADEGVADPVQGKNAYVRGRLREGESLWEREKGFKRTRPLSCWSEKRH